MQDDGQFRYKIDFIAIRWNWEELQQVAHLPSEAIPASTATADASTIASEAPKSTTNRSAGVDMRVEQVDTSLGTAREFYAPQEVVPPRNAERLRKSRYAKLMGAAKGLMDDVTTPDVSDLEFQRVIASIKGATSRLPLPSQHQEDGQDEPENVHIHDLRNGIPLGMILDIEKVTTKGRPKKRRLKASYEPAARRRAVQVTETSTEKRGRGRPRLARNMAQATPLTPSTPSTAAGSARRSKRVAAMLS
jgi:hypothetical protein